MIGFESDVISSMNVNLTTEIEVRRRKEDRIEKEDTEKRMNSALLHFVECVLGTEEL